MLSIQYQLNWVTYLSIFKFHVASKTLNQVNNKSHFYYTLGMAKFLLCCFSEGPIDSDPFADGEAFQTSLDQSCCENPGCCVFGLCCPCCASCKLRKDYLRDDMSGYACCQKEIPSCCCFEPGKMGEQSCPNFCLCIESFCCTTVSISSTRSATMRTYGLSSDPFDRQLIRFTNCMICLSCLCQVCNCKGKDMVRTATDIVVATVMGCMVAQVDHELSYRQHKKNGTTAPPLGGGSHQIVEGYLVPDNEAAPLLKSDMVR